MERQQYTSVTGQTRRGASRPVAVQGFFATGFLLLGILVVTGLGNAARPRPRWQNVTTAVLCMGEGTKQYTTNLWQPSSRTKHGYENFPTQN
jgi:hypothetical protein